jgi:VanZ family protein
MPLIRQTSKADRISMLLRKQWRALLWTLIILVLTGLPGDTFPEVISFWDWLQPDKVVHIIMFAVLSFIILYDAPMQYLQGKRRYLFVIAVVSGTALFGLLTEILQYYVFIGRSGNVYDVMADCVGALTGWLLFDQLIQKKIIKNSKPTAN